MVDTSLILELDATVEQLGRVIKLAEHRADEIIDEIATRYVDDRLKLHWWDSLKVLPERIYYGQKDGLPILANWVEHCESALLVVTDDDYPPWPVYSGSGRDLMQVLQNSRFFECILAAADASWVVFDTHMNELLRASARPGGGSR